VAPGNFRVLSSTSTALTLAWSRPDPLNGMFGAYELQYGTETDFLSGIITLRLLFTTQFTVSGIQGNMIYRLQVRASTISLSGETLWGPFSTLRVQNGQFEEFGGGKTSRGGSWLCGVCVCVCVCVCVRVWHWGGRVV